ncbi:MAG: nucleotidyltransferase domain-containing protein [Hamadaea sp.]|nr:nucleotidyltransferase domain-containing protein [Hamadaea sp.]NUR48641.1 nucleotidyltransferase domain-containing protein [Hamadaea sp.]NUT05713.1 nucleotidyltransferase domain-containing protein [Hamadaea sp.]
MEDLRPIAARLAEIPGVVAVALGGSRARGTHRPDSDIDLGLYYRGALSVDRLRALARELTGTPTDVTEPGGWGPWVNGGGWLTVDGWRVDWIYRDLDRVRGVVDEVRAGRYEIGVQPGHPLGFYSHAYAGEVALGQILADPTGELTGLKALLSAYPRKLADSLAHGLWEADFLVGSAKYAVAGADPAYAAGCLFRMIGVLCHAVHAHDGAWLINEKGMIAATGRLPSAPPEFAARAQAIFAALDPLEQTVADAAALVGEVRSIVDPR